jgi:hypothetical protein
MRSIRSSVVLGAALLASGCAHANYLPGTTVPDTPENRAILETVDLYRERLIQRNVEGLLLLASPKYFEDGGTPRADDDYGYEGLRDVLVKQLARLKSIRYDIQYSKVLLSGRRAEVEAFVDGSFELIGEGGNRYRRKSDWHRFVLERDDAGKWKFVNGM